MEYKIYIRPKLVEKMKSELADYFMIYKGLSKERL